MALQSLDYTKYPYPLKLLLEGNADALGQLYEVIASFRDQHLQYRPKEVESRSIGEIITHIFCTQYCYYTYKLVCGKKCNCPHKMPRSIKEALEMIELHQKKVASTWEEIPQDELEATFQTEWGQVMSKELALFQSIEHTMYHVGEICYIAGLGGFYKGILG